MNFRVFLISCQYILAFGLGALAVSGLADQALGEFSKAQVFSWLVPLVALSLIVLVSFFSPKKKIGTHLFLLTVSLIALSGNVFQIPSDFQAFFFPVLFLVVTFFSALVRKEPVWLPTAFFIMALVAAEAIMETEAWNAPLSAANAVFEQLAFGAALFTTGLIPWGILKQRELLSDKKLQETLEVTRNNALVEAMSKVRNAAEVDRNTADFKRKTSMFSIDQSSTDTFIVSKEDGINEQLGSMVYFMSRNFKAFTSAAFIYDPEKHVLLLNCYHSKSFNLAKKVEIPYGEGVLGRVASENRLFMSGDLTLYVSELMYYSQRESINSILAVPVTSENNEMLGALVIDSRDKNAFREQDKELMRRFASIAAALITNIRMSNIREQAAKTFKIFYEASHRFTTALKFEDVYNVLFEMFPQIIACNRLISITYDEKKKVGRITRIAGAKFDIKEGMEFPLNSGLYSFALLKHKVINIPDMQVYGNKYYRFKPDEAPNPTLKSLIIFPIIRDDKKKCLGLFSVESSEANQFSPQSEQILTTLIENASVALTRSSLYQKMERLATTDGLTELNNHRTFQEVMKRELERARRYTRPLSLLLMDIDHFKSFNDTYGHPVGDLVLREIACCIRSSIRCNDIPARYGGEEFAVVIPESGDQGAVAIAQRIRQCIEQHVVRSGDNDLHVTVSIGCAVFPFHGKTQQEIIDAADKALYYAKEHGRNQVVLYRQEMVEQSV
ncbi:MAG: diguanylate cyclase [Chitinispirillaceae bacterium]